MLYFQHLPGLSGRLKIAILATCSIFLLLIFHTAWQQSPETQAELYNPIINPTTTAPPTLADEETLTGDYIQGDDSLVFADKDNVSSTPAIEELATRPAIIAAARATEDLRWMEDLASEYEIYPYNVDDRDAEDRLAIPQNKGHEAMVYLTWLINNYHNLPPYAIFLHGHKTAWHQEGNIVRIIRILQVPALEEAGYVPLRCDWYPSCPAEIRPVTHDAITWGPAVNREEAEWAISEVWDRFFPGVEVPLTISSQCCAQFAVTRDAMQRRSKDQYTRMRDWILETDLHDDISGRVLEKLWAYIMTDEPVHCPSPHTCSCKYFGRCTKKKWPIPPEELGMLPEDSL